MHARVSTPAAPAGLETKGMRIMPRFMEYKESTYRLLTLVVWTLGIILLAGIVYAFALILRNALGGDGWKMFGLGLQALTFAAIVAGYFFFLYWQKKLGAIRASIKGFHAACEGVLNDDGMGTLLKRDVLGELGLRYEVVHHTAHTDKVFGVNRYLDGTLDYSWTVFSNKITDQGRDLLPIALMPGFNNLAAAMRGWALLNKSRHFGATSEHVPMSSKATEDGLASLGLKA